MTTISIPFKAEVGELGLKEASGIISYNSKDGLGIEFQTKDSLLGLIKSGIKKVQFPWDEVSSFEVIKKWFSAQIVIRANSLTYLAQIPWFQNGQLIIKINKADLETARRLRSELLLMISEKRLELLEDNDT